MSFPLSFPSPCCTMNAVFPLPRLPPDAQLCVLKSMCLLDIISFSRISKATECLVVSLDLWKIGDIVIDPIGRSKIYEFWLRPENYADLPLTMAFEMFKAKMIDVTRFCYHIRECREVPDNLEWMCEYVVRNTHFPTRVQRRREDWINWSHFLEESVFSQTSQEFEDQEKKHEKNLEKYKQLLLEMDMRSGGTQSIMLFFDAQQKMMSVNPVKALAMVAPNEWTSYVGFSEQDRQEYRRRFTVEMSNLHYRHDVPLRRARHLAAIKANQQIRSKINDRKRYQKYHKRINELRAAKRKKAAESKKAEEAKKIEVAKKVEEAKKAEEAKKVEEAKKAEEAKKTVESEKKLAILKKIQQLNRLHSTPNESIMEILRLSAEKEKEEKTEEPEKKAAAIKKVQKLNKIHSTPNKRIMEILRLSAPGGQSK